MGTLTVLNITFQSVADPGFLGGGGAQKIMCPHTYYERGIELTFGRVWKL